MNTIDDLRTALRRHADDLPDEVALARRTAVQQRVRVARQRRRAALGGGLAAAVALVLGAAVVVRPLAAPEDLRPLAGHTPPAELTSLGFRYAYDRGDEGSGRAALELDVSDRPRLVTWAGSGGGDVTVTTPSRTFTDGTDFADFTVLSGGESGEVAVTGDGRVAVAVYTLDGLAPGVSSDGALFRDAVARDRLLEAAFGDADHPVDLRVSSPTGRLRLASVCRGAGAGVWFTVLVDGGFLSGGECGDHWDLDAGTGGGTFDVGQGMHTVTSTVTRGPEGPEVSDPGIEFGVGVYAATRPMPSAAPFDIEMELEYDGHRWELTGSETGVLGATRFTTSIDQGPVYVVAHHARLAEDAIVWPSLDGEQGTGFGGGGAGSGGLGIAGPGSRVTLRVDGDPGPRARLGIALYRRVD